MGLRKRVVDILYKAAISRSPVRALLTPLGAFLFFLLIGLFIVGSLLVDKFLEFPKINSIVLPVIAGIPLLVMGLLLMLWSVRFFFKARGTPVPFNPPPRLIATGPYAYVRNPMLTGLFIVLLGLGVLLRSISLIFIFTPVFVLINVVELKLIEEPELEKRIGREYIEYRKRTPMFIPRVRLAGRKRAAD